MSCQHQLPYEELLIDHLMRLLTSPQVPDIPAELADNENFRALHETLVELRETLYEFSKGNINNPIKKRGFIFGSIKALQAHLQHFIWQVQQVANHDFTQRVDFLGELSTAFNTMVVDLATAREELEQRQEELAKLAESLKHENRMRSAALHALKESEAKFKYLAEHDPLTESLNRRSFLSAALVHLRQAELQGDFCALAMLDVDYFKKFNDQHGHAAGDEALRHLVAVAKKNLRSKDMIGRYGGEEFVFFFASANEKIARNMAERIRKAAESSPVRYEDLSLPMTVSLGVCVISPKLQEERNEEFLQKALNIADEALYAAKAKGRNNAIMTIWADEPN